MCGWTDGGIDGRTNGRVGGLMYGPTECRVDVGMSGWLGRMDRSDGWAEGWTGGWTDEWTDGVPTQQIHTRTLKL